MITLDYGIAYKGRWKQSALWLAAILVGVLCLGWKLGAPQLWHRVTYAIMWHRCEMMSLPAGTVVYDEEPVRATRLLGDSQHYTASVRALFNYPDNKPPAGWVPPACYQYPLIKSVYPAESYPGVVFLHARRTKNGIARLVLVDYGAAAWGPEGHNVILRCLPLDRGSWNGPRVGGSDAAECANWERHGALGDIFLAIGSGKHLRLMAGHPDPHDESHFFIPYAVDSQEGLIEGWLRDVGTIPIDEVTPCDSGFVELEVTSGTFGKDRVGYPRNYFPYSPRVYVSRDDAANYAKARHVGLSGRSTSRATQGGQR